MGNSALNVVGLIVAVAAITAVVGNANSASVIGSMGQAFASSIDAALGKNNLGN